MNIITKNPVITEEKQLFQGDPSEYYYSNTGTSAGTSGQGKIVWDKVKQAWVKAKESGLLDKGAELLRARLGRPSNTNVNLPPPPPPAPEPEKMSQTTKTLLIVGGVVTVVIIIFLVARQSGKNN
jgi:hypothetical protein